MVEPVENRWFPPSPHKEHVLAFIATGQAHIVERGHNVPPLLVFEDGGAIELPLVRYQATRRGMVLTAADGAATRGATRFYDVCGSVDEIKGVLAEADADEQLDADYLRGLLSDIGYMLARMARRGEQYRIFAQLLSELAEEMLAVETPPVESAEARVTALEQILDEALVERSPETLVTLNERAEEVRDLANGMEHYLGAQKALAVRIGEQFRRIKGGRNWDAESDDQAAANAAGESGGS